MFSWSRIVLIIVLQMLSVPPSFAASFEEELKKEERNPSQKLSDQLRVDFAGKHLVFVDGIMSELAGLVGNYYSDNIIAVEKLGISSSHLGFSSKLDIPRTADRLFEEIEEIYRQVQKPLVLIGHSKGGNAVLYMILKNPELMLLNYVDRVVLLASAIGGSPIAETLDLSWSGRLLSWYLDEGVETLRRERSNRDFLQIFSEFQEKLNRQFGAAEPGRIQREYERLSQRVFFLRNRDLSDVPLSLGLQIVLAVCQGSLNPDQHHDGLLYLEDQLLNTPQSFGTDLGILDADHIELVVSGVVSRATARRREAFTRVLLQKISPPPSASGDASEIAPDFSQGIPEPPEFLSGDSDKPFSD